jgi:pimeloyl-ACP methyl ester carboxylesterase
MLGAGPEFGERGDTPVPRPTRHVTIVGGCNSTPGHGRRQGALRVHDEATSNLIRCDPVQIDGRRLEVAWWGPFASTRVPIVLLHEGLGSVSLWRDFPAELAAATGRRVMAYSRFGHGASDLPRQPRTIWFMHDEARLLPMVLATAGIRRSILFGHSDGGSIALIATAEGAIDVAALVLEAPHVFVEDVSVAAIAQRSAEYEHVASDLRTRLSRHHQDVDAAFRGWRDVWLAPKFRNWNIEPYLPCISCPTLLIQGVDDQFGTLHQIDAIAGQLAGSNERLVLPECGHSPHRDQREAVLRRVASFVQPLD